MIALEHSCVCAAAMQQPSFKVCSFHEMPTQLWLRSTRRCSWERSRPRGENFKRIGMTTLPANQCPEAERDQAMTSPGMNTKLRWFPVRSQWSCAQNQVPKCRHRHKQPTHLVNYNTNTFQTPQKNQEPFRVACEVGLNLPDKFDKSKIFSRST